MFCFVGSVYACRVRDQQAQAVHVCEQSVLCFPLDCKRIAANGERMNAVHFDLKKRFRVLATAVGLVG